MVFMTMILSLHSLPKNVQKISLLISAGSVAKTKIDKNSVCQDIQAKWKELKLSLTEKLETPEELKTVPLMHFEKEEYVTKAGK